MQSTGESEWSPLIRDPAPSLAGRHRSNSHQRGPRSPTSINDPANDRPLVRSQSELAHVTSYGTLRSGPGQSWLKSSPDSATGEGTSKWPNPSLTSLVHSRRIPTYFNSLRRRPSHYDAPPTEQPPTEEEENPAEKVNGIRVWYSSFQSIDWLHDAVCDAIIYQTSLLNIAP
jgi:hypothetical protein